MKGPCAECRARVNRTGFWGQFHMDDLVDLRGQFSLDLSGGAVCFSSFGCEAAIARLMDFKKLGFHLLERMDRVSPFELDADGTGPWMFAPSSGLAPD